MKKGLICLFLLWSGLAFASPVVTEQVCERMIRIAENKQMDWIYPLCGFQNSEKAFDVWGSFVSAGNYKKAMYALCTLNPDSPYAPVYCDKAAQAGYVPAMTALAQKQMDENMPRVAFQTLQNVLDRMPDIPLRGFYTDEEKEAFKAYEQLGFLYLNGVVVETDINKAYHLLKKAAQGGRPAATHALGILLFWNPETRDQAGAYWWKSVLQGCPAAEENLGILYQWQQGKITEEKAQEEMEKRLYSCDATVVLEEDPAVVLKSCDCPSILSWYMSQRDKPYLVLEISGKAAKLQDNDGKEETVSQGETTKKGYYVQEVRSNAVVLLLTSTAERIVLVYRQDRGCYDKCRRIMNQKTKEEDAFYQLAFTPEECAHLAYFLEELDNPDEPYVGMNECALPDWGRWGQQALEKKRNKHLYILKNYRASDYIPSFLSEAEYLFSQPNQQKIVANLLTYASQKQPIDRLSLIKQEQAYCIKTYMHMKGPYENGELAYAWAKAGAEKGYPQSMNMMGVLYAVGLGVPQDSAQAASWFLKADENSSVPFVEALYNYHLVRMNKDLSNLRFGSCKDIATPREINPEEVLKLY